MADITSASTSPQPATAAPMDTTETVAAATEQVISPAEDKTAGSAAPDTAMDQGSPRGSRTPPRRRSPSPPPAPTAEELEAQATKKRKLAVVADESKKRGRRMFGLLQSTLKQAKTATDPSKMTGAAAKRKELEDRLAKKLQGEKDEMEMKHSREREQKELKLDVVKREEEIGRAESIYEVRHATKLHLARFLCTSFQLPPPPPPSNDGITVPYAPRLPHAQRLADPARSKPIYYLPYKLTARQEDQIEDQLAAVKKAIRHERDAWEDQRGAKVDGLQEARRRRDERVADLERAEREKRQERRREAESREERARDEKERNGGGNHDARGAVDGDAEMRLGGGGGDASIKGAAGKATAEDKTDDVDMENGASQKDGAAATGAGDARSQSPVLAVKGTAATTTGTSLGTGDSNTVAPNGDDSKMVDAGGEDDIEY